MSIAQIKANPQQDYKQIMFSVYSDKSEQGTQQVNEISDTKLGIVIENPQMESDCENQSKEYQINEHNEAIKLECSTSDIIKRSQPLSEIKRIMAKREHQVSSLKKEIQKLQEKCHILLKENQYIKDQNQALRMLKKDANSKLEQLQSKAQQRDKLEQENLQLKKLVEELQTQTKDKSVLSQQFKLRENQYEENIKKIQESTEIKMRAFNDELSQLKAQLEQQKIRSQIKDQNCMQLKQEMQILKQRLSVQEKANSEIKELTQTIQLKADQARNLQEQIQELSSQILVCNQNKQSLSQKIIELNATNLLKQKSIQSYHKKCLDMQGQISRQRQYFAAAQAQNKQNLLMVQKQKIQALAMVQKQKKQTLTMAQKYRRQLEQAKTLNQILEKKVKQLQSKIHQKNIQNQLIQNQAIGIRRQSEILKIKLQQAEQALEREFDRPFANIQEAFKFVDNTLVAIHQTAAEDLKQQFQDKQILRKQEERKNVFRNMLIGYIKEKQSVTKSQDFSQIGNSKQPSQQASYHGKIQQGTKKQIIEQIFT